MKETLGFLILCSLLPPAWPSACPLQCDPGLLLEGCECVQCKNEHYWQRRNGQGKCAMCTTSCFVKKNLVEVSACTTTTDRKCQCKPGFYCPNPVSLTCRRDCEPCINGFSNTTNLNRTCQPYTNCAILGMVVIKEGSPTEDRKCGKPTTSSSLTTTSNPSTTSDTPSTPSTTTLMLFATTHTKSNSTHLDSRSIPMPFRMRSENPVTPLVSETTVSSGTSAENIMGYSLSPEGEGGSILQSATLSKTTWIFLLLLVVLLLVVLSCLSLRCKSRAIKDKLEWAGLAIGRYQPVFPAASAGPNAETVVPMGDVMDSARGQGQGQGSFPGGNQQVTMEHIGKGEGINNTVGSIFIYSPGMVILGSNSNERKEEAEASGEDSGEDSRLMSVPQQESNSGEDTIRLATQEELGKELSFPVPATSK